MKYIIKITLLAIVSLIGNFAFCENQPQVIVSFSACQKTFVKQSEPFFYVVLSALAKNNYKVEEIQSKNGLIIFKVYNKEFLANITKVDFKTTLLKLTPADNNYAFQYSIVENIFKTIEEDLYKDIYKLN